MQRRLQLSGSHSKDNQEGYVLGMVLVFFVVFTMIGLGFVKMGGLERMQVSKYYHKTRAFYYADAGISKGLWLLNKVSKAAATYSDATVSVQYDSVSLVMKAIGSSGGMQDSVRVTVQSGGGGSSGSHTLRPTANGAYSNNYYSGGSTNWACVEETVADEDAQYIYGPSYSWYTDTYVTEDPTSGQGTIDSVVIHIRVRTNYSGTQTRTVVYLSGTRYYGSIIDLDGVSSYTNYSTAHSTNPNTSSAWTWSEVNDMQIGVRMYGWARCTQVWAAVHYSGAGGGGQSYTVSSWEEL